MAAPLRDRFGSFDVASLARMLYRFAGAIRRAAREETFVAIVGSAIALVLTGTVVYTLGEGWSLVDGFYFSVCTLTTCGLSAQFGCGRSETGIVTSSLRGDDGRVGAREYP